jgi:hypothetical protein
MIDSFNIYPKCLELGLDVDVDPHNAYTIEEVEAYLAEHPEMEVEWSGEQQKYIPKEVGI